MPLKRSTAPVGAETAEQNGNGEEPFEIKENPRVNAQIDGYIKANPKQWAFLKSLPRERLERAVVWEKIRNYEQRHKLDNGLLRKIEQNPALKKDYEALLKHIPEDTTGACQSCHCQNTGAFAIQRAKANRRSRRLNGGDLKDFAFCALCLAQIPQGRAQKSRRLFG